MTAKFLEHLTGAVVSTTGRRYCSSHRSEVADDDGAYIICGHTRRWLCSKCRLGIEAAAAARVRRRATPK